MEKSSSIGYMRGVKDDVVLERLDASVFFATQSEVNEDNINELAECEYVDPVDAVKVGETYYLIDGHHRALSRALRGELVETWVLTLP